MRSRLVLTIALLLIAAVPAHAQQPRAGGELVYVVGSESPSYDAHREETFGLIHPAAPHYSTLLRVDPTDTTGPRIIGDLAESWTTSKDGLTYTFKIRRGVKFHDGSALTARDVKASYDKIINPPPGLTSPRKGQYAVIEALEAPDAETVIFRLKHPSAGFLSGLASPWNWIYKADILAKDPHWYEKNVMGTGPFTFVEHVKGSHWVGKRFADYWDRGRPYLDGYRAIFIPNTAARIAAVRGERALIEFRAFNPSARDAMVSSLGSKITVKESAWDCALWVVPHHEKKPWDDTRVRRALTLAVDRWSGSKALSQITIVKEVGGIQVRGPRDGRAIRPPGAGARRRGAAQARPRVREAPARRAGPRHPDAVVAPDRPVPHARARLHDHAEPLPERPARHDLAGGVRPCVHGSCARR